MSHTPGPWKLRPLVGKHGFVDLHFKQIDSEEWSALASVVVRFQDAESDNAEGVANARLIASAPELLEALKAVSDILEHDCECPPCVGSDAPAEDALGRARAVIAKATGGEPDEPPYHTVHRPPQGR